MCGKYRECSFAGSDHPVCPSCSPRATARCARCGQDRPPQARWPEGPVCDPCYTAALRHRAPCASCGQLRRLVARTLLSTSLAAGAELKTIQDQLGHSSIVLTADTYISVMPDVARKAAEDTATLIIQAGYLVPGTSRPRRPPPRPVRCRARTPKIGASLARPAQQIGRLARDSAPHPGPPRAEAPEDASPARNHGNPAIPWPAPGHTTTPRRNPARRY